MPAQASPEVAELPVRLGRAGGTDVVGYYPGSDADDCGAHNISSMMGNVGGVNASMSSSVVAVDPLDPSKLVAVWIDNDPTMFADTISTFESVLEAAYSTDAGAQWNALLAEPINGLGIPQCSHSAQSGNIWTDEAVYKRLKSKPGL